MAACIPVTADSEHFPPGSREDAGREPLDGCAGVQEKRGPGAAAVFLAEGGKVPRHIVFAELPKTSTGKIQKHVLRSQAKDA